ncbi:MAG: transporter substrate-binding domain-containing protein [Chloroflexi bacterium]|nr:transporter substrate-binding domain-containing protein [Chloroflexota bacterium]
MEYGSGGDALVRGWMRLYPDVTLQKAPTAGEAMLLMERGAADAAVVDAVSAYGFLAGHPGLRAAGPPLEDEPYTLAVNVRSTELLAALNEALAAMEADGTLAALRAKWRLGSEGHLPLTNYRAGKW